MSDSIENQIHKSIVNYRKGKIFFPSSFLNIGSSTAIRQALLRLVDKGILIRLAHGIYLYPKKHKRLGLLYPSTEEIAIAISKRDKSRIIPAGVQALNKLGLSTQVPLNYVYLTDGSARTIEIGNRSIKFKKAHPKILKVKSDSNLLIIQALKEIGEKNLDQNIIKKINRILFLTDENLIKHDLKLAPNWIAQIMKNSIINKTK